MWTWRAGRTLQLPSVPVSTVYEGGFGGKKANWEASRDTEHLWLQSMHPSAVLMTQPMVAQRLCAACSRSVCATACDFAL